MLGYLDPPRRDYKRIPMREQVEVLSLVGDVALKGAEPVIHAHVAVGRSNGAAHGGHLRRGAVGGSHHRPVLAASPAGSGSSRSRPRPRQRRRSVPSPERILDGPLDQGPDLDPKGGGASRSGGGNGGDGGFGGRSLGAVPADIGTAVSSTRHCRVAPRAGRCPQVVATPRSPASRASATRGRSATSRRRRCRLQRRA